MILSVLFISGLQILALGLMDGHLGRIFTEVKRRPLYVAKARLGLPVPPIGNDRVA